MRMRRPVSYGFLFLTAFLATLYGSRPQAVADEATTCVDCAENHRSTASDDMCPTQHSDGATQCRIWCKAGAGCSCFPEGTCVISRPGDWMAGDDGSGGSGGGNGS